VRSDNSGRVNDAVDFAKLGNGLLNDRLYLIGFRRIRLQDDDFCTGIFLFL